MQGFSFTSAQDPELAAIEKRRRMAELLQQQAQMPLQAAPGAPISPLSGLAKMLRSYTGARGIKKADEEEQAYENTYNQALATYLQTHDINALQGAGSRGKNLALAIQMQEDQQKQAQAAEAERAARVLTPEQEAQKVRIANAGRAPALTFDQQMELAHARRAPVLDEFGVTPQLVQKPDGWYERLYSKTGKVTERKIEGEPVRGMQYNPELQGSISQAKTEGTQTGEAAAGLADREASLPRLEEVVNELSELGKTATYTAAGQAGAAVKRQLGMDVGAGPVARAEYIAKIDNEILPLLRQTFGAQFTEREGQSLKATLGDPDKSPAEKDAVLRSFINSKKAQIETMQRRVGDKPNDGWSIEEVK